MTPALRMILMGGSALPRLDLNFSQGTFLLNGARYSAVTSLPGFTFTRATPSVAYAETLGGQLIPFAAGTPRITDKGLLVEEAGTNLLLQSQAFATSPWSIIGGSGLVVANNAATAPDGTTTASLVTAGGGSYNGLLRQGITITAGLNYTLSVYVKAGTARYVGLRVGNWASTSTVIYPFFDLQTNTTNTSGQSGVVLSMAAAGNGYTRLQLTLTNAVAGALVDIAITDNTGNSQTGAIGTTLNVWGADLKASSVLSSYIPTTTAAVTRAADVAYISGLSSILGNRYTLGVKVIWPSYLVNTNMFAEGAGITGATLSTAFSGRGRAFNRHGAARIDTNNGAILTSDTVVRMAVTTDGTRVSAAINGAIYALTATPAQADWTGTLYIGSRDGTSAWANTYIQRLQAMSDVTGDGQLTTLPQ